MSQLSLSVMADLGNHFVVFSFINPKEDGEVLPYSAEKQLLVKAIQRHKVLENGELLNTLERRALYPFIYCSVKPLNEIDGVQLLKMKDFGDSFALRQGIYVESQRHEAPKHSSAVNYPDDIAYIFMGFKSVDLTFNETLEKSWKDWTSARLVNACLRKEFHISRYSFFHRIGPSDPQLFMYILIIECHNVKSSNKTYLLDFVQRLRVERVFGYLTVYKRESLSSTSAIINGLLADPDEYVSKDDIC